MRWSLFKTLSLKYAFILECIHVFTLEKSTYALVWLINQHFCQSITASQQCVTAQWIQPEVLLSLHVTEWKLLSCFFSLCLKLQSYEPQVTWAIFQSCWHSAAKTTETFITWEPGAQSKSEGARWDEKSEGVMNTKWALCDCSMQSYGHLLQGGTRRLKTLQKYKTVRQIECFSK